ncbi:MAG: DUF4124 domain-containing protein [Xanthomonadales bacterium]|jgi:hypothetical protein|nr:DUF4124 domain-containing protein [Xanthomonadales bacterium]
MKRLLTKAVAVALATLALATTPPILAETIYKWVDESGTVHYGERPPEGVDAELVTVTTAKPRSGDDPYAATRTQQTEKKEAEAERMVEQTAAIEQRQQEQARLEAACAAQKSRLEQLIPRSKVLLQNPDGTSRMLGDDERLAMIEESQKFVDENCPDD